MGRPKRNITKPLRYKTISSNQVFKTKTVNKTKNKVTMEQKIENDINLLEQKVNQNFATNNQDYLSCNDVQTLPTTSIESAQILSITSMQNLQTFPTTSIQNLQTLPTTSIQNLQTFPHTTTSIQNAQTIPTTSIYTTPYITCMAPSQIEQTVSTTNAVANFRNKNYNTDISIDCESHTYSQNNEIRYVEQQLQSPNNTNNQKILDIIHARFDLLESEIKKMNDTLEYIAKSIQKNQTRQRSQQKPIFLPISTEADMVSFENADEETYEDVVDYFLHAGGFTAKEAINLSFKEAIKDNFTTKFTWFGQKEGLQPLYNTRIIRAIYDAVSSNSNFCKPSRTEFQAIAKEALRSAKQRHRLSIRSLPDREHQTKKARNYWNDEDEQQNGQQNEQQNEQKNREQKEEQNEEQIEEQTGKKSPI